MSFIIDHQAESITVASGLLTMDTNTGGLAIPKGNTATRAAPRTGIIRYNTDSNQVEYYNGTAWTTQFGTPGLTGPVSSTPNAIALWNGTTGAILKDSSITIDGTSNVSGVAQLNALTINSTGTNLALTTTTSGNITITPASGNNVIMSGLTYPNADGTANYGLTTNGGGILSFTKVLLASNNLSDVANIGSSRTNLSVPSIAELQNQSKIFATATGSSTAYSASVTPAPASLTSGLRVCISTSGAGVNTVAGPTFQLNGLGSPAQIYSGLSPYIPLPIGQLPFYADLVWDGAVWICLNPVVPSAGSITAWVNINTSANTIRNSYNVSSITTITGTVRWQVNFASSMINTTYAAVANSDNEGESVSQWDAGGDTTSACRAYSYTTTSVNISIQRSSIGADIPATTAILMVSGGKS